jgi:hypothetical protein
LVKDLVPYLTQDTQMMNEMLTGLGMSPAVINKILQSIGTVGSTIQSGDDTLRQELIDLGVEFPAAISQIG